jgi:cell division septal protein FtsQ
VCLLGTVGIIGGLGGASHIEKFAVRDVAVEGAVRLPAEALSASVESGLQNEGFQLFSRRNIFLYPAGAIEETLREEFPRIQKVSLSRNALLAQAVTVTVEERKPYASWCDADSACFVMDKSGFIFDATGEPPEKAYVFRGGLAPFEPIGQTFLRGSFYTMIKLLEDVTAAGYTPEGITVESEKDFSIPLTDGPRLLVPFDMETTDILRNLETTLSADAVKDRLSSLEYIDLRFGNRVYYK